MMAKSQKNAKLDFTWDKRMYLGWPDKAKSHLPLKPRSLVTYGESDLQSSRDSALQAGIRCSNPSGWRSGQTTALSASENKRFYNKRFYLEFGWIILLIYKGFGSSRTRSASAGELEALRVSCTATWFPSSSFWCWEGKIITEKWDEPSTNIWFKSSENSMWMFRGFFFTIVHTCWSQYHNELFKPSSVICA